jgi:hypothetical protein
MKIESYSLRTMPDAQCHVNIERNSFDRYANVELEVLYRVDCSATTAQHGIECWSYSITTV